MFTLPARGRQFGAAAALAAATVSITCTPADATPPSPIAKAVAAAALKHVGQGYREGATGPRRFDCSGLVVYLYRQHHVRLPRTADQQFHATRRIAHGQARAGDLVFYHSSARPRSYVYHVAIYEGHGIQVAAATPRDGVVRQPIWSRAVTFGRVRLRTRSR